MRADVPGSPRHRAIFDGAAANWRAWGELMHSVETGEPAFNHVWRGELFDYVDLDPRSQPALMDSWRLRR